MKSFQQKLEKILRNNQNLTEEAVRPEKGEDVTHGTIDGTGKIDATGPIQHTGDSTLKTSASDASTAGPTGHIPTNSDLPRPQGDGLDADNKNPGKKAYGLHEEEEDDKDKVEEGKLPAFLKKDDDDKDSDDKEKKEVKEESEDDKEESEDDKKTEEAEDAKDDKKAVAEATAALFRGEQISEAFKEKTSTIFEATLSLRLKEIRSKLNERYTVKLNERVEEIRTKLSESVDAHLDLVVENWVKQNEIPLEKAIKAELVEEFISGLKNLCEEHYIELPDDKVDVVAEMAKRISQVEQKLNESYETNADLQKRLKLHERTDIFAKVSKGMADTQVEKLKGLSESIDFKSAKQFETALTTLKESVGQPQAKPAPEKKTLAEQTLEQNPEPSENDSQLSLKVKETLARMAKK
jgi:hypothetical protein